MKLKSKLLVALAAVLIFGGCTGMSNQKVEEHFIKTADDWELSVFRYQPDSFSGDKAPVILCPGLICNNYFWDLDKNHSFARYLADHGYDVWSVSLRGAGNSTKNVFYVVRNLVPILAHKEGRAHIKRQTSFDARKFNWTIDDHIKFDVPAVIDYVREKTGRPKVTWIGHSMGGMLMYGYLPEDANQENVNAFVSIAAPAFLPDPLNDLLEFFKKSPHIIKPMNVAASIKSTLFFAGSGLGTFIGPYNPKNMKHSAIKKLCSKVIEDIAPGVLDQYYLFVKNGAFVSADSKTNYADELAGINVPVLLMAGKYDNLVPQHCMRYVYENVASQDKTFRLFGTINGYKANYGHGDLIIGRHAQKEVYPFILKWLDNRPLPKSPNN